MCEVIQFTEMQRLRATERRLRNVEDAVRLAIAALRDHAMVPRQRMQAAEFFLTKFVSLDDSNHHSE